MEKIKVIHCSVMEEACGEGLFGCCYNCPRHSLCGANACRENPDGCCFLEERIYPVRSVVFEHKIGAVCDRCGGTGVEPILEPGRE